MNIAKNTAKRMLESIEQQLHSLAAEQQSMNGNKGGSAQFRCGGRIRRKMQDAGNVPPAGYTESNFNWGANFPSGYGMDQYKSPFGLSELPYGNMLPFRPMYTGDLPTGGAGTEPVKKVALDPREFNYVSKAPISQYTGGVNLPNALQKTNNPVASNVNRPGNSGTAMDWMGLLPTAFNLGAGLFSGRAQQLNANRFQNPYEQQSLAMMPSQYRIDPLLNEYRNAYANTVRNINNQANSRGERMANYGAAANQYSAQTSGAYADKFNQENQMAMRKAMMMNEQGQRRAATNLEIQNMNDQNRAAAINNRMGYLGAAATGAQRYSLVNRQMAGQQKAQDAWLWAIQNIPHFKDWVLGGIDQNNPLNLQKHG